MDCETKEEIPASLKGTKKVFENTYTRCEKYLQVEKKSLTYINHYIRSCSHLLLMIENNKSKGVYGNDENHPLVMDMQSKLTMMKKQLEEEGKVLENLGCIDYLKKKEKGDRDISLMIANSFNRLRKIRLAATK